MLKHRNFAGLLVSLRNPVFTEISSCLFFHIVVEIIKILNFDGFDYCNKPNCAHGSASVILIREEQVNTFLRILFNSLGEISFSKMVIGYL